MKQRILSAVLAAALCLGIIGVVGLSLPAQAAGFSDIGDADVSEAVSVLSSLGIVSGYSDGTFRPSETLTRAQFATLAVLAEGHGDQVAESAYRTLFSDLPASHWAAPYVNLAQSEGLISGYGNGRFGPDDPVTIGQAVTIVLRLMGYGEEDVAPFWPQDYLSKGADLGLLEGVRPQADAAMTRGEAALLLYAMLQSSCKDGTSYVEKLAHSIVSDAVLLQNDDTSPSGEVHTAQVYAGNSGLTWYTQDTALPDTLLNRRGTLLLNESGAVSGFLPDESTVRTLSLAEAKADRLVDESGASYTLSSAVTLVLDDTVTTYGEAWYELDGRETVTLYYSASGSVNLVTASETKRYDGAVLTGYYRKRPPQCLQPHLDHPAGGDLPGGRGGGERPGPVPGGGPDHRLLQRLR
ncbi:S-layer homology domain-containing protein [Pseudoflavonifractor gallinarum]|uniref:S-layer homology domain-containing protein n=1 Tax=Pseudoflavonifractor gallinarum TaxID=2779352 RepID=UPI001F364BAD|nr:S-layer homology domain-containing protein [Pseudoflavonifractor gallinarum]